MMSNVLNNSEMIEEYKKYIENNVLKNSFDFSTWCQHQYGNAPKDFSITPEINFSMVSKNAHK